METPLWVHGTPSLPNSHQPPPCRRSLHPLCSPAIGRKGTGGKGLLEPQETSAWVRSWGMVQCQWCWIVMNCRFLCTWMKTKGGTDVVRNSLLVCFHMCRYVSMYNYLILSVCTVRMYTLIRLHLQNCENGCLWAELRFVWSLSPCRFGAPAKRRYRLANISQRYVFFSRLLFLRATEIPMFNRREKSCTESAHRISSNATVAHHIHPHTLTTAGAAEPRMPDPHFAFVHISFFDTYIYTHICIYIYKYICSVM